MKQQQAVVNQLYIRDIMAVKIYREQNVLDAARDRIAKTFDSVERVYVAFSGGKDSSVMFHLVMEEAIQHIRIKALAVFPCNNAA